MDSLFDNLIFLIPVAIFIGRIVTAAKNKEKDKKKPAPKWPDTRPAPQQRARPAVPEISIHFEDDVSNEVADTVQGGAPVVRSAGRTRPTVSRAPLIPAFAAGGERYAAYESAVYDSAAGNSATFGNAVYESAAVSEFTKTYEKSQNKRERTLAAKSGASLAAEQASFPLTLNKLSPLKQAVVMAEVLGPPKGLL